MSEIPPPPPFPEPLGDPRGPRGRFAGFWIRLGAAILDALIIGIPMGILGIVTGATDSTVTDSFGNRSHSTNFRIGYGFTPGVELWFNALNLVVGVLYFASLEGGATGQTLGKRICNLRVVDEHSGQPGIGFARGVGRYFARWLSAIPLLLGYLWMLWDPKKQCWHDKLVRNTVVEA